MSEFRNQIATLTIDDEGHRNSELQQVLVAGYTALKWALPLQAADETLTEIEGIVAAASKEECPLCNILTAPPICHVAGCKSSRAPAQCVPKGWLYTLRGAESYSPTRLPHCVALGWHEIPLYEHLPQDERHELPGHEETMAGLRSLTIRDECSFPDCNCDHDHVRALATCPAGRPDAAPIPDQPVAYRGSAPCFAANKREEMRHLAEYLERYRLSDPHIGPDDCDLIVAALSALSSTDRS